MFTSGWLSMDQPSVSGCVMCNQMSGNFRWGEAKVTNGEVNLMTQDLLTGRIGEWLCVCVIMLEIINDIW